MSLWWISYITAKPPKGWLKKAKCPKFEQWAAITPKRYEIGCQLVLITNRKSHTGFRLMPSSMTLNDLERPEKKRLENSPYFVFFHGIRQLCRPLKPVMSAEYYMPDPVFHDPSLPLLAKTTHPAARSLCDSWATCYLYDVIVKITQDTENQVNVVTLYTCTDRRHRSRWPTSRQQHRKIRFQRQMQLAEVTTHFQTFFWI